MSASGGPSLQPNNLNVCSNAQQTQNSEKAKECTGNDRGDRNDQHDPDDLGKKLISVAEADRERPPDSSGAKDRDNPDRAVSYTHLTLPTIYPV